MNGTGLMLLLLLRRGLGGTKIVFDCWSMVSVAVLLVQQNNRLNQDLRWGFAEEDITVRRFEVIVVVIVVVLVVVAVLVYCE